MKAGIWIDQSSATILAVRESGEDDVKRIVYAKHASHRHPSIDTDHGTISKDATIIDFIDDFIRYYTEIISCVIQADTLYIFGPDEAKERLRRMLESEPRCRAAITVEPAFPLTESQILARIRRRFRNYSAMLTLQSAK